MPPIHRTSATAAEVAALLGTDPFPVAQAVAAGISRGRLRAAVGAGQLRRVRTGVLVVVDDGSDGSDAVRRDAIAALAVRGPEAVVSHETAAWLEHLPDPRPGVRRPGIVVTAPVSGRRRNGVRVVEGRVDDLDVALVDGVRCTSVGRTALDLAVGRRLPEALVLLDAAAARVGDDDLRATFDRMPRTRHRGALGSALSLADARSESPLESASRGEMLAAGLPAPELQAWVVDDEGRAWRVDFLWRATRVVGEADGWGKYRSPSDLRDEKRREDALRRAGWTVVRWTSEELWGSPQLVVARIARALTA